MIVSRKIVGWSTAALVVGAGLVAFGPWERGSVASSPGAGAQRPALEVTTSAVIKQTVPIYLDYVGTTEALRSVTLQAKVSGYLVEQAARDGADVQQGDLLYRIDPRDYQAAIDQATAQLRRDAAARDYARSRQSRSASLAKDGWVTKDALEQNASSLQQSDALLAVDEAAIRTAKLQLSYTEIKAPFAGRLSRSNVHEGSYINATSGTQLNTLVQLDPIRVSFSPSEHDLAAIVESRAAGDIPVRVSMTEDGGATFEGTLSFLDNVVDRGTGTIAAQATIANSNLVLLPGQYVHIRLLLKERPNTLLVPKIALGSSQLGKFVFVVGEGNRVEQRFVSLGGEIGQSVIVENGVAEGDRIIVDNLQKIGPGAPVKAKPAPASTAG